MGAGLWIRDGVNGKPVMTTGGMQQEYTCSISASSPPPMSNQEEGHSGDKLKKKALRDLETSVVPDLKAGRGLNLAEEENLMRFFKNIGAIQFDMKDISNLFLDLQHMNDEWFSVFKRKYYQTGRDSRH